MITEKSPILSLLFAKGLGTKTLSRLLDQIAQEELSIDDAVALPADELIHRFGLRPDVATAVHAVQSEATKIARELDRQNIHILIRGLDLYPTKLVRSLRSEAPPVLFARGNLSILDKPSVGFCGSRKASPKGIQVAGDSARLLAHNDVNVVSGYAKGVDLATHVAALEAGGVTTIVLAEGILHFRPKREIKELLAEQNYVAISEYPPRLPWSVHNAMQRNRTICGLSDAVVVIESGLSGGTFASAETALELRKPLFVAEYAQPADSAAGNKHFIQRGAIPLRGDRAGRPNLQRMYEVLGIPARTIEANVPGGDTLMDEMPNKYEIVASPLRQFITAGLRIAATSQPWFAPFGQAWSEYETYRTDKRIQELITGLARELDGLKGKGREPAEAVLPPPDFAELLELTVEKVTKEFEEAMRAKYARLLARIIADGEVRSHAEKVDLVESLDTLSELDLRVLELFKGKEESMIGDLGLQRLGLDGDPVAQTWKVACNLAKLEARGLILKVSTKTGVVKAPSGLDNDAARWRETRYRLLPVGESLIRALFE